MPQRKKRSRPRRILVDEEATSAPHAFFRQDNPLVPLEFLVPHVPQA